MFAVSSFDFIKKKTVKVYEHFKAYLNGICSELMLGIYHQTRTYILKKCQNNITKNMFIQD